MLETGTDCTDSTREIIDVDSDQDIFDILI